ncbi:MAG: hypothetical protein ACR2GY_11125 [Phycisphaerales bacterium]
MDADFRIISIGAMAAHPLWNESQDVRADHATTVLIESQKQVILVDPSLPPNILLPRLSERSNRAAEHITHIFLTSFEPMRRRGLSAFTHATWLISERERETIGQALIRQVHEAREAGDDELLKLLTLEVATLQRCEAAPDSIADGVDLFPLPGVTAGTCGLLLPGSRFTTLICGDAVATIEHLKAGKVLQRCADIQAAQASFAEAIEIADVLVPGRDNVTMNPVRGPF